LRGRRVGKAIRLLRQDPHGHQSVHQQVKPFGISMDAASKFCGGLLLAVHEGEQIKFDRSQ